MDREAGGSRGALLAMAAVVLAGIAAAASPVAAQDRLLVADFAEVYRAGGLDAPDWAQFSRPGPVAFDASGNLYVLDAAALHVVVIDPDGQPLMAVGRAGEGPGEFELPSDLVVWRDGRFAVLDAGRNALHIFGADGWFQRMVRWYPGPVNPLAMFAQVGRVMRPDPIGDGIYAQGALDAMGDIIGAFDELTGADSEPGRGVDQRGIEHIDIGGDRVVAEPVLQGWRAPRRRPVDRITAQDLMDVQNLPGASSGPMFYDPGLQWDVLPDGTIAYSDSSAYVIWLASEGLVRDVLARPIQPEPVDDRIRLETIEWEILRLQRSSERMSAAADDPDVRAAMAQWEASRRERVENREFFTEVPVIRTIRATWDGALWVQRRGEEPWDDNGPIDIFTRQRQYLGTFPVGSTEMPLAFGPDGLVAFWELDELDVPTIVVRRLPAAMR